MVEPRDSDTADSIGNAPQIAPPIDGADAMIAWWLGDKFNEHLDRCYGDAMREALEE